MPNIVYTGTVQKTEVNCIFTCWLSCLFCLVFNVRCWVRIVRGWAAFGPYHFTAAVCVAKASALSECGCLPCAYGGGGARWFHQWFWHSLHLQLPLHFCMAEELLLDSCPCSRGGGYCLVLSTGLTVTWGFLCWPAPESQWGTPCSSLPRSEHLPCVCVYSGQGPPPPFLCLV